MLNWKQLLEQELYKDAVIDYATNNNNEGGPKILAYSVCESYYLNWVKDRDKSASQLE